jgi:alpha-beta hydrolase superfamily lysophospholipase
MTTASFADGTARHELLAGDADAARGLHLLLVHGLGEHVGRYRELIGTLGGAGHLVTAFDQRGHGRSGGPRGGIPSEMALLADLGEMVERARRRSALPLVLLGHSMGGAVAARFVAEGLAAQPAPWWRAVDGLVLSSPALAADLNAVQRLLLALGRLRPDGPAGNGLKPAWISRDAQVVRDYVNDPLVHDRITPRLARFILDAGEQVRAAAPAWRLPTLLLWAGADRCVAPRGSAAFAAAAPRSVLTSQVFDGLYHEIFNEPERATVIRSLLAWLSGLGADRRHAPAP